MIMIIIIMILIMVIIIVTKGRMWFFLCVCLPPATGGKEHLDQDDEIHDDDDDEIHPDGDRPRSWVFHHCKCWSAGKQNLGIGIVLTIADGIGITSKIFIIVVIIISSPTTSTSPLSFSLWSPSDHHHLQKRPKQSPRQLSEHSQDVKSQRNPRDVAVDDCGWWPKNKHYPPPDHHHRPGHLFLWLSSCSLDSRRRHAGTVAKLKDNTYSDDDIWGFVLSTLLMTDNADDHHLAVNMSTLAESISGSAKKTSTASPTVCNTFASFIWAIFMAKNTLKGSCWHSLNSFEKEITAEKVRRSSQMWKIVEDNDEYKTSMTKTKVKWRRDGRRTNLKQYL